MKINRKKLELAMARACKRRKDMLYDSDLCERTLERAFLGYNIRPDNVGKIAKALDCDVMDIVENEV